MRNKLFICLAIILVTSLIGYFGRAKTLTFEEELQHTQSYMIAPLVDSFVETKYSSNASHQFVAPVESVDFLYDNSTVILEVKIVSKKQHSQLIHNECEVVRISKDANNEVNIGDRIMVVEPNYIQSHGNNTLILDTPFNSLKQEEHYLLFLNREQFYEKPVYILSTATHSIYSINKEITILQLDEEDIERNVNRIRNFEFTDLYPYDLYIQTFEMTNQEEVKKDIEERVKSYTDDYMVEKIKAEYPAFLLASDYLDSYISFVEEIFLKEGYSIPEIIIDEFE